MPVRKFYVSSSNTGSKLNAVSRLAETLELLAHVHEWVGTIPKWFDPVFVQADDSDRIFCVLLPVDSRRRCLVVGSPKGGGNWITSVDAACNVAIATLLLDDALRHTLSHSADPFCSH